MLKHETWQGSERFLLENDKIRLVLLSYGARINELVFAGKDVVIGYDTMEDLRRDEFYTNAVVGRYANRIADGRFSLNGTTYQLEKNENGVTHLHGGTMGFDRVEWDWEIEGDNSVRFYRLSPHMEMGYPGNLTVSVTYTLEDDGIAIRYRAMSDRDTVMNLTNHAYFNLDGFDGNDCREMEMRLAAPYYLPVDDLLIPVGKPESVAGTRFDFQKRRPIGEEYDHCFVFENWGKKALVGELYSPASGIGMNIYTDLPGIQVYTCIRLESNRGKKGIPLHLHQAVALETQFLPDSPNHPAYPSTVLKGGTVFDSTTHYRFFKK